MPNIATALKDEIARVARKELRGETQKLKTSSTQYRSDIAALKRRLQALEQQLVRMGKASGRAAKPAADEGEEEGQGLRFSAKGFGSQRARLGLSVPQLAAVLGVSVPSVYKWEDGKTRPRASQLPGIAALRKMGKKEALAKLNSVREAAGAKPARIPKAGKKAAAPSAPATGKKRGPKPGFKRAPKVVAAEAPPAAE